MDYNMPYSHYHRECYSVSVTSCRSYTVVHIALNGQRIGFVFYEIKASSLSISLHFNLWII